MDCASESVARDQNESKQCSSTKPTLSNRLKVDFIANQEENMFINGSIRSLDDSMNVGFENVSYSVTEGFFNRGRTRVNKGVSLFIL